MDKTVTNTYFEAQEVVVSRIKLLNATNYPEFVHYLLLYLTKGLKDNQEYILHATLDPNLRSSYLWYLELIYANHCEATVRWVCGKAQHVL